MRHAAGSPSTILADTRRPLPPDWRWTRLGDLCHLIIGRTPRREMAAYWGGDLPWVTISDLNGAVVTETRECITRLGAEHSRARLLKARTLLFSFKLTIGKVAIAGMDLYTNEAIAGLIPRRDDEVDRDYLRFALASVDVGAGSSHAVKGRTLNQETLAALEIPTPSISEQRRIATVLADELATVERVRVAAEAQLEAAKALPAAYRRAAFTSAEAQHWARVRLGDLLLEPLRTGISKPARPGADKECLTLSAIRGGFLELSAKKAVGVTDEEANGAWVRAGAFYVVRGNGRLSLVGRGALAPPVMSAAVLYPDLLIQVIPDTQAITLEYLRHVWESEEVRADVERRARTSAGIFKINQANLAEVRVPLPDREEQEGVATRLDLRLARSDQVRKVAEERLAAVNNAPAALLRRAFSGDL